MENQYDIKKWEEEGSKKLFVWQFFLDGKEIPGWELTEKISRDDFNKVVAREYYWKNKFASAEVVKIDIFECPSWKIAQVQLLNFLQNHMAEKLQPVEADKFKLADAAFTGFGKIKQHILFVRANMVVVLNSIGDKDISVDSIARIVDEQFFSRPKIAEKKASPEIEKFSVADQKDVLTEKGVVALDILVADPTQRPLWYKFFADHGEFFSENENIYFVPEENKKSRISVLVTNENGYSAERSIDIG